MQDLAEANIPCSEKLQEMIEKSQGQWLISLIQKVAIKNKFTSFSVWKLFVDLETNGGMLKVEDAPTKTIDNIPIRYAKFPIEYFEIYIIDNKMILPIEY